MRLNLRCFHSLFKIFCQAEGFSIRSNCLRKFIIALELTVSLESGLYTSLSLELL